MEPFEILDVSSDAGLRIRGRSLKELFSNAARGFYYLVTDPAGIEVRTEIVVRAAGESLEGLLVAFLNELVYFFDTEGFAGREVEIDSVNDRRLEAVVRGEMFDPGRHERRLLVKAATYHNISVRKSDGLWEASVIFDI